MWHLLNQINKLKVKPTKYPLSYFKSLNIKFTNLQIILEYKKKYLQRVEIVKSNYNQDMGYISLKDIA